jgi:hypothetical protein
MVQFNFSERTIKAKVVYYGPAQSGKTTNLEQIHRLTDPTGQNRLISLNTAQDRTLFFDLLPFSLGAVSGYDFKIQVYTVPGQVQYNATRRVVLAGADAVVFVADSQKSLFKENLAAFENMKVNLLANRLVPEKVPLVFQLNKRDLTEIQSEAEMNKSLNAWGRPSFPAVAARGEGVIDTFVAVVQDMLTAIALKYNLKEKGLDPATIPEVVTEAFAKVLHRPAAVPAGAPAAGSPARLVVAQAANPVAAVSTPGAEGLVGEELLHRAIRSNVELAEALAGLVREVGGGLAAILAEVDRLQGQPGGGRPHDARLDRVRSEALRLQRVMQQVGDAGASAAAGPSPPAARPPATAPPPARPDSAEGSVGVPPSELGTILQEALTDAREALASRGLWVDLQVPPGVAAPRCPRGDTARAVVTLLRGVADVASPNSAAVLRGERKPVLLRSRDGSEVRRDYLMLALVLSGSLSPDEQQRIAQGAAPGPLGDASRLARELGGFIRFAPLPGGKIESRLFLPAV